MAIIIQYHTYMLIAGEGMTILVTVSGESVFSYKVINFSFYVQLYVE